jgi:4-amino-4-deoxy-L-arabinose transferase-like glycosyltransferase
VVASFSIPLPPTAEPRTLRPTETPHADAVARSNGAAEVRRRPRASPWVWVTLAAILALAAFLRLWHLDALGANSDEAVYAGQAASIASQPQLEPLFPIFRAHPLLFQTLLSVGYHFGGGLEVARVMSAVLGIATVAVTFSLGRLMYGAKAGLLAALFMAAMPYHVVVTRQVLLDGPMTLCATLSLYLLARFAITGRGAWLYASAGVMGATVLCKETSILLLGAVYSFFALAPEIRLRVREAVIACAILGVTILQFPLVLDAAGGGRRGGNYLVWQLFRRPNHDWGFYPQVVPVAIGLLVVVAAAAAFWVVRRRRSWRETLLLSWIAVPTAFFQLWPVKGFQYLLPIAPAVAVLAGMAVAHWWSAMPRRVALPRLLPARLLSGRLVPRLPHAATVVVPAAVILLSLLPATLRRVDPSPSTSLLAGSGGMPGGREAGLWLGRNVPPGAQLMTIGPSMANVLTFYGHHRAFALSVSPNPLNRNPSYEPLVNPDLAVREARVQYAVWDAFSAGRSPFFAQTLLRYVERYQGRLVHQQTLAVKTARGRVVRRPSIAIYVLRP